VAASLDYDLSISSLAKATAGGKPAVVAVIQNGGGHAIVVDGVTTRQGAQVVAIRDPWGRQYFERVDQFEKRYLGIGIVVK
jgi:hypothetical protein